MIHEDEASNYFSATRRRKKWTGWRPKNDGKTLKFEKAVMSWKDEKQETNLETIQESTEKAAGNVAHSTKKR